MKVMDWSIIFIHTFKNLWNYHSIDLLNDMHNISFVIRLTKQHVVKVSGQLYALASLWETPPHSAITHCIGDWVRSPRAVLDVMRKIKCPVLFGNQPLGSAHNQSIYWLEYYGTYDVVSLLFTAK
jgi:hypothetical protein